MSDYPRRRRLDTEPPQGGGGIPIVPLAIAVILAGLLVGGLFEKLLNKTPAPPPPSSAPSLTPLPTVSANPTPSALSPTPKPSPTSRASASAKPSATPKATATPLIVTPKPSASARASAAPTSTVNATPTPLIVTPRPSPTRRPEPTPSPTPASTPTPETLYGPSTSAHARSIGRSYIQALISGQESIATGYLQRGLPSETMLAGGSIQNIDTTLSTDGSYFVNANVNTPTGPYYVTLHVVNTAQGMQIAEHSAVKG